MKDNNTVIEKNLELFHKIRNFRLDDPDSSYNFSDRLALENGWSIEYTLCAIEEYKKFMFLLCISDNPLTPSDQVDQVWHLHLLYTHSYWDEFCDAVLQRKIHHGPTQGGDRERLKYAGAYQDTLDLYRKTFKHDPPSDIWPDAQIRFSEIRFRRVNLDQYYLFRKFRLK